MSFTPSNNRNSLLFRRAAAFLVDSFLLGFVQILLLFALFIPLFSGVTEEDLDQLGQGVYENPAIFLGVLAAYAGVVLFLFMFNGLYFCLLQSSSWQGTLGKRLLGLKVTDCGGRPIGFHKAFVRYLIRFLLSTTGVLLLVDFLIGFTNLEGQTIHDLAAKTLVVDSQDAPPPLS